MKFNLILLALTALLLVPVLVTIARAYARPPGELTASNTAGTHEGSLVTRITEAAVSTANLLLRKGTADRQVLIGTATARPLGAAYDTADAASDVTVCLLGGADSVLMVASKAIAVDAAVYTDASGKVTDTLAAGCWLVGYALSSAAADGDEIEVQSCVPVLMGVPVTVSATGGAVTALQAFQGIHLSNLGAAAAATFTLPAALVGMRVTALVEVAQELRLDPNGTETIALPSSGVQGAAGKYLTADAIGEKVQLVCVSAGTWDVINYSGTWTAEA
jgi:hypothetical protein